MTSVPGVMSGADQRTSNRYSPDHVQITLERNIALEKDKVQAARLIQQPKAVRREGNASTEHAIKQSPGPHLHTHV